METENLKHANFPLGPAAIPFASPHSAKPFLSSGAVVGSEASPFRPTPPTASLPRVPSLSSEPMVGQEASVVRPMAPDLSKGASRRPTPSAFGTPPVAPFQHFLSPQLPSTGRGQPPGPSHAGQTVLPPPLEPSTVEVSAPPVSFSTEYQLPSASMGSPPQIKTTRQGTNFPQFSGDSAFSIPGPNSQPSSLQTGSPYFAGHTSQPAFPGYPSRPGVVTQALAVQSTAFPSHQRGYIQTQPSVSSPFTTQGGYIPSPSAAAPFGMHSREAMQQPGSVPPMATMQGLVEDFSSLSVGSVPGSFDSGLDSKAFPRPLDSDMEPNALAEMYPMNCSSRFVRLTTGGIPNSQSLASRWHLPLGAIVCPLAESPDGEEVPVVNFTSSGIIRCKRCRTYVNPYVSFTDSGRKWRCNICSQLNDVPSDYHAHLDANGRRIDLDQRPELTNGSVEFIAPAEYMVRPPIPPLYFFLIDVSISAVKSGMLEVVAQTIKCCLDRLPGFPRTQIGFITYDSTLHFYNMKSSLTQPQMMVMSDLDDIFVPLPDDLLVNLSESRTVIDVFLDSLTSMFQDNMNVESAFGPALRAAFMVMNQLGGKLLIFQNTLPSLGVGRLRLRGDDLRVYGTDKEHTLRIAEDPFYKQMAADFTKYNIAVNVYAFSEKYTDIASLGTLAKYTGGQVYYYPSFQSAIHKDKLRHELSRDLTRETAWEAVMRVRCGKGIHFTSYHGNFMLRSTDLLALPAIDCDKAYAMQLSLEETVLTTQTVYFQVALLYTSSFGERRIRVHTVVAPVVTDLGQMYRLADIGAVVSLFSRLAIEKTLSYKLEEARNFVQVKIVKALREYRNLYAVQHRLGGRLIFPESLKLLPLYGLALCKSTPLRGGYGDVLLDERCAAGYTLMALPVTKMLKLLYPSLIRVDEYLTKALEFQNIGKGLPLMAECLDTRGLYIFDDGFWIVIWFGTMLSPKIVRNLLGEDFSSEYSKAKLSEHDNEMSRKLMAILEKIRENDPSYYQLCHLVKQGDQPREGFYLFANLMEDQICGSNNYADWILQVHRQVQQNA